MGRDESRTSGEKADSTSTQVGFMTVGVGVMYVATEDISQVLLAATRSFPVDN